MRRDFQGRKVSGRSDELPVASPFKRARARRLPFIDSNSGCGTRALFLHSPFLALQQPPKRKFEESPKASDGHRCLSVHATPSKHPLVAGSTRRCFLLASVTPCSDHLVLSALPDKGVKSPFNSVQEKGKEIEKKTKISS